MAETYAFLLVTSLLFISLSTLGNALSLNYYANTCPGAEFAIANAVVKAFLQDKTVLAALLRLHFHDCFIRGCDASVLLKSAGNNTAEKDGPPNVSLHSFYVIDNAKKDVEALCPGIVSCADILALAARDAVVLAGGPNWEVPIGRKDGRTSMASETRQLPTPAFNISQLQQSFSQRGLSMTDLVALSASLKKLCLPQNKAKNSGSTMDPSSTTFDNIYYKQILQGKALFSSDQALLTVPKTKTLVSKFATSNADFLDAFVKSMVKMSSLTGGKEVRKDCRVVN